MLSLDKVLDLELIEVFIQRVMPLAKALAAPQQ
jgi:hypothetical protein